MLICYLELGKVTLFTSLFWQSTDRKNYGARILSNSSILSYISLEIRQLTNFRPERWGALPEKVFSIPGVWGHMLSFSGGSRTCIGYQFSILE